MRFSSKGLALLEITESPEAIEVLSRAPGVSKPVVSVWLGAAVLGLEPLLLGDARYECSLGDLELVGVDYGGSEEGGTTLWPMHYLALRFGPGRVRALHGHEQQALLEVYRRLLAWQQSRPAAKQAPAM